MAWAKTNVFVRFSAHCSFQKHTHLTLKVNIALSLKKKKKKIEDFPSLALKHPIKSLRIKLPSLSMFSFSIKQILISPPPLLIQESEWPWPFWFASFFVHMTSEAVFVTCLLLGSQQGVLSAYLDNGKKKIWFKTIFSFIFLYFRCKSKDYSSHTHTKVLQICSEAKGGNA